MIDMNKTAKSAINPSANPSANQAMNSDAIVAPAIDAASAPYLGRWHRLVSTTNWEKGRIIQEWRVTLSSASAPASEFSDEAWSRRVGNVTGQHVGRLRRVYERFGEAAADFSGLYWSHFQSALDWDDAEMWLEGAVQSRWSVAEMRRQRWQTRSAAEGGAIDESESESDAPDENFAPLPADGNFETAPETPAAVRGESEFESSDRRGKIASDHESDDATDDDSYDRDEPNGDDDASAEARRAAGRAAPFAHLVELPEDLAEAFESFKLAIVRHRLAGWRDAACDDVLAAIDALRELALAPVE